MKLSLFALPVFSALAVAGPVAQANAPKGGSKVESLITGLTAQVKQFTGHMNETLASLPENPSFQDRQNAAESVNKDIKGITTAFQGANAQIADFGAQAEGGQLQARQRGGGRPTLADLPEDVLGQLDGRPIVLARLLMPLLRELNPALQSVLTTLSLGQVYTSLQPLLTVQLPALVTGLSTLVQGLLAALAPLLTALGGILGPLLLALGL